MFNRWCGRFTRLLVLWVVLAVVAGYLRPGLLAGFRPHTEWLFALTMLGIGMVLRASDFAPVARMPHTVLMGTLAQFAIMPAAGFLVARGLRLPPDLALGVILTGSAPGAMASNVISYLARADVAYSIALTSVSTLLAPVLTPLCTSVFGRTYVEIPFWPMVLSIVKMVIVPLLAGFAIKGILRERIRGFAAVFPALSALFIAFICGLVVALNRDHLARVSALIFAAVILHNSLGLLLGYAAGALYRFDLKRRRTLALEVGMQNAGLGAVLALKHFSAEAALPSALFATWCVITASVLAEVWSRKAPGVNPLQL
ncbi:MAG: bile acid:sodium symporter family protein [bacterium]|nr:bile acid:sodium symporter family protein [bacterium]